jgi:hypothetical protein
LICANDFSSVKTRDSAKLHTVLVLASCCVLVGGAAEARELTQAEAKKLVTISLGEKVSSLPRFGLDPYEDKDAEGFYVFEATAQHPRGGSPVIGQFAVNKATGDVWRLGICERMSSVALIRERAVIRKRTGIRPDELNRLAAKAPCQP